MSLHEGDREKDRCVERDGQRGRESLRDGEKMVSFHEGDRENNRSKERGTEGKREPDRRRKIGVFA